MIDGERPLFVQIAELVEDSIVDEALAENAQAPSINELAAFYHINPATAAKGINLLVDKTVLTKRRGVGMFVTPGAKRQLVEERRAAFAARFLDPLLAEAARINMGPDDVVEAIRARVRDITDPERSTQ